MRRTTTGNGTWKRQWIYILVNIPFFFTVKIGITGKKERRIREINRGNIGIDLPIFALPVFFAYQLEQFNKRLWTKLGCRVRWFRGTGKTERFYFPAAITAIIGAILLIMAELAFYGGLLFGIAYTFKQLPG